MSTLVELIFWLSAAICGIAVAMIETGGRVWWLALLTASAFAGGMCLVLKAILHHPQEIRSLLKE